MLDPPASRMRKHSLQPYNTPQSLVLQEVINTQVAYMYDVTCIVFFVISWTKYVLLRFDVLTCKWRVRVFKKTPLIFCVCKEWMPPPPPQVEMWQHFILNSNGVCFIQYIVSVRTCTCSSATGKYNTLNKNCCFLTGAERFLRRMRRSGRRTIVEHELHRIQLRLGRFVSLFASYVIYIND